MEEMQRLEALQEMFLSKGWQHFKEEYSHLLASAKEGSWVDCPSNDEWQFRRGVITFLTNVMGFENYTNARYEQLVQGEEEDV